MGRISAEIEFIPNKSLSTGLSDILEYDNFSISDKIHGFYHVRYNDKLKYLAIFSICLKITKSIFRDFLIRDFR